MTDMATIEAQVAERKAAVQELEERGEQAARLGGAVADMRKDLNRFQTQAQALSALGDAHVEIPYEQYLPQYGTTIAFQPFTSLLSGKELAGKLESKAQHLLSEIARHEQEIASLLEPESAKKR